jgi:hypothetical protein
MEKCRNHPPPKILRALFVKVCDYIESRGTHFIFVEQRECTHVYPFETMTGLRSPRVENIIQSSPANFAWEALKTWQ